MEVRRLIDGKENAELVARIRAGDDGAQAELCKRFKPRILRIIKQSTSPRADAENLCQETLMITLRSIEMGKVREPEKLSAFIKGVVNNLLKKYFRKDGLEIGDDAKEYDNRIDPELDQLEQLLRKERAKLTLKAINLLKSDRDREVLYRYYILEDSKQDICADLNISSDNFPLVVYHARNRFKKIFQEMVADKLQ
jgi:RNA polymerase sigma-70 factor, ECF subfamily